MRIALVCGGRNIGRATQSSASGAASAITIATAQRNFVAATLTRLHLEAPFSKIIGGEEGGAERLGIHWAATNKIATHIFGRSNSGFRGEDIFQRNSRMLREGKPDIVIAFGEGQSTNKLLEEAAAAGVATLKFDVPEA
jgi:hypothetical protein